VIRGAAGSLHVVRLVLAAGALLLAAPAPVALAQTRGGVLRLAPAPDLPGPHPVGRITLNLADPARGNRPVTVDVWYPVDPADAHGPRTRYALPLLGGVDSERALAGPPASPHGPFPLVVFSHGNFGIRFQSYFLAEALASHGFVVASPDHYGNTLIDGLGNPSVTPERLVQFAVDRVLDVRFVIDRMLAKSADPQDAFARRVDPSRIGVSGHSFGGFTTLAIAGGFGEFQDPRFPIFTSIPRDPRVKAIVPLSPASGFLTDGELASITIPTMILCGTDDRTTPFDPQSTRPFAAISSRYDYRSWLERAGHFSFTNICDLGRVLENLGIPKESAPGWDEGCTPDLLPIDTAHRLTNLYVVAFFQRHLRHDLRYDPWLSAPYASRYEPEVDFLQRALVSPPLP
jgi:predicted dienelactone hydrolase